MTGNVLPLAEVTAKCKAKKEDKSLFIHLDVSLSIVVPFTHLAAKDISKEMGKVLNEVCQTVFILKRRKLVVDV